LAHNLLRFALFVGLALLSAGPSLAVDLADRRYDQALEAEKEGQWLKACRLYDELVRKDRTHPMARMGYQRCLRRLHQSLRQADPSYRAILAKLTVTQALDLFEETVGVLSTAHAERERVTLESLFTHGMVELRNALEDPEFVRHHLSTAKPAALAAYKNRLLNWTVPTLNTKAEVREQVLAIVRAAAKDGLTPRPVLVAAFVLEFAAGATNAIDEYGLFMTPGHLAFTQAMLKGRVVHPGLEIGLRDDRVQVTHVYPKSSASEAGVVSGDRIQRINGVAVADLPAEAIAEKLRGPAGSTVEVAIERFRDPVKLQRRPTSIPSVEYAREDFDGSVVLRLRINYFGESTLQEVKDALASIAASGDTLHGVLLDLRGNPGGLFESAIRITELFLDEGTIVVGRSPFKKYDRTFKAANPGFVTDVPVVVLVDGDTASAAEVVAGALKESRTGRFTTLVMGQNTFGKGSIQCVVPLDRTAEKSTAVRITVAKLFSPTNQPYTGKGITPHLPSDLEGEALLNEARKQLLERLKPMGTMPMMPTPPMPGPMPTPPMTLPPSSSPSSLGMG
jgi:carboxyl-terminal processing protease